MTIKVYFKMDVSNAYRIRKNCQQKFKNKKPVENELFQGYKPGIEEAYLERHRFYNLVCEITPPCVYSVHIIVEHALIYLQTHHL